MASNSTEDINKSMSEKVADATSISSQMKTFQELGLDASIFYTQADAFIGNPYALLGSILELRKTTEDCPTSISSAEGQLMFSPSVITGVKVDDASKIKEPVKRGSVVVDEKLSLSVNFLNYLGGQFEQDTTYSLMVFDQMAGLAERKDGSWDDGLDKWKERNKSLIENPATCAIYVVFGFVQKYIIRRKFKKFALGVKGGVSGLNINGELYTGNEDFTLDIRYGLQIAPIKYLPVVALTSRGLGFTENNRQDTPSLLEMDIINKLALSSNFKISSL